MRRKIILRLSVLIVFLTLLGSCQQELLQTEQDYSLKSQQSSIQQLTRSQLEKKDPQLVSKLDRLKVKKTPGNARIYTDTENGFSVDTDKAIYVEDVNGNKTYTFKIERNNGSSAFLENLVLKQIGNSEYQAYISKYDQMAVENLGSIARNDLKNHITFTLLGTKTGAEVFGKNSDPYSNCIVMQPDNLSYVYVGGALCYTGDHDYAHIYNCNYQSMGQSGPTPGYYTWEVSYSEVNICTGLPQGNTTGGSTTPLHGGGGSIVGFDDPCTKAKPSIDKANEILHTQAGINMKNDLETKAPLGKEWALALGKDSNNEYHATASVEGSEHSSTVPVGLLGSNIYIGDGHTHSGNPAVPSAGDLYTMLETASVNPDFIVTIVYGVSGTTTESYALVINSQAEAIAFLAQYPRSKNYDPDNHGFLKGSKLAKEIDKMKTIFNNKSTAIDTSSENYNTRAVGLAYMLEKLGAGISIAKVDANNKLKKINATIETIPNVNDERARISKCPN